MNKRLIFPNLLILAGIALLVVIYFVPVWWVSLTAPNYPPEAFPDGVRIHFHMNGVFNGCKKVDSAEITEDEALDCVHEMDTINHYVGMYPIAAGGVVERAFSPFLVALLAVMLLGFVCIKPRIRMAIMSVGFGVIAVWMAMTWYGTDGLKYQSSGYLEALVLAMDQDSEKEKAAVAEGDSWLAAFRQRAGLEDAAEEVKQEDREHIEGKSDLIDLLKATFERNQERQPANERLVWDGSGSQMMSWHYRKNLGRYFNNPEEINPMVNMMATAAEVMFWGIIAAMLLLIFGARQNKGLLYWLLILVPMALPLFFLIEYSAWLWWYGHTLNAMGAFTVKPFMPTVIGQGKVAQFATHSYPAIGFGLMMLMSVLLAVAALLRRKLSKQS